MAYADIMAKVSSCLSSAGVPFSQAGRSVPQAEGAPGGGQGITLLTHQLMLLPRAATWRRAGKMAKKEVKKRKWRCPLR